MIETQQRYDYKIRYKRGPVWVQLLGRVLPESLKVLIVFTPAIGLVVLTVLVWAGVEL